MQFAKCQVISFSKLPLVKESEQDLVSMDDETSKESCTLPNNHSHRVRYEPLHYHDSIPICEISKVPSDSVDHLLIVVYKDVNIIIPVFINPSFFIRNYTTYQFRIIIYTSLFNVMVHCAISNVSSVIIKSSQKEINIVIQKLIVIDILGLIFTEIGQLI